MMKLAKNFALILTALFMLTGFAMGEVIVTQGFETNLTGYSHTPSQTPASDPGDQYFYRAEPSDTDIYEGSVGPYTNVTGSWLFVGSNPNTINASSPGVLSLSAIDVSGHTDLEFSADFGGVPSDWDAADQLSVEYSWNNSDWSTLYYFVSAGTNMPLDLAGNATGGNNTANGTTLTYALTSIVSDNFTGTGSTLYIRVVCNAGSNYEAFGVDNIVLSGTASGGIANPTDVSVITASSSQINLTWTDNASGDDVMVVFDNDGTFTDPTDGVSYSGSALGGTVIYQGTAEAYNHSSLTANTAYHYKFWSVDASDNYSPGTTQNATTAKAEPAAHVTSFSGSADHNTVTLTWTDATADGYLVKASTTSLVAITAPVDGTDDADDEDMSDGSGLVSVPDGDEELIWDGLDAETTYYFKIYPFNNSGSLIDYKTDGSVPEVTQATAAAPVTVPPAAEDVVITELCDDGSGGYMSGFMEIYNNTSSLVDMEGAYIKRFASDGTDEGYTYTFGVDVTIPANGFLIVARGQVEATFESEWSVDLSALDANYDAGNANLYFTTGRMYKLYTSGDALIDTTIAVAANLRSIQSDDVWSATETDANGTPGTLDGGQVPTPITLASFTAKAKNGKVELAWETASEVNNARFVIYRNDVAIASIEGAGTTSEPQNYSYVDAAVVPGVAYTYVLADVDYANVETKYEADAVTVTVANDIMDADFVVNAAYPNPFNPSATISYQLSANSTVKASVYNTNGTLVEELLNSDMSAGSHELVWNAANMPSGVYILKMFSGNIVNTQKLVLMK